MVSGNYLSYPDWLFIPFILPYNPGSGRPNLKIFPGSEILHPNKIAGAMCFETVIPDV